MGTYVYEAGRQFQRVYAELTRALSRLARITGMALSNVQYSVAIPPNQIRKQAALALIHCIAIH